MAVTWSEGAVPSPGVCRAVAESLGFLALVEFGSCSPCEPLRLYGAGNVDVRWWGKWEKPKIRSARARGRG